MGKRKRLCMIYSNENEVQEDPIPNEEEGETINEQEDPPNEEEEEEGPPKKVRGYTMKSDTWSLDSKQKIVVTFNHNSRPIGDEGNELTQFMGTLVRMDENVAIDIPEWRMVPDHKKEDLYSMIKAKFVFEPAETREIRDWILSDLGKKWRTWKGLLKERAYDESLKVDEIVAKHCEIDKRVNAAQFRNLVTKWFEPDYVEMCKKKSVNREKMLEPHVSGTKSYARLAQEEHLKTKVYPTRGQIYVKAHTRKAGKSVPEQVNQVMASLLSIGCDSTQDPFDYSNDDYSKVKGPEKRGYIRCVGRIPAVKASSSGSDATVGQMKTVLGFMGNIINNMAPNPELLALLKSMNIQMPSTSTVNQPSSYGSDQIPGAA